MNLRLTRPTEFTEIFSRTMTLLTLPESAVGDASVEHEERLPALAGIREDQPVEAALDDSPLPLLTATQGAVRSKFVNGREKANGEVAFAPGVVDGNL